MGLPCQHRIDAASVYICSEDSAWDTGRILDEERSLTTVSYTHLTLPTTSRV